MKYRTLAGEKVSVLGFGCMRFPLTGEKRPQDIDIEKSTAMLRYAYEHGVNYYDSAYVYHNDKSEEFLAQALGDVRDKIHIATKLPTWRMTKEEDFDFFLNDALKRLNTDYIDFYLIHALDKNRFENILLKYNMIEKLNKAKADGKIRHIGFSFHDDLDTFKRIIDANPAWEFCQVQLNYINTDYQAGLEGIEYAKNKGVDVVVMEPLLGGRLSNPNEFVRESLSDAKEPVEWALDFLWNRSEVSLLLSGMSTMEQVVENVEYADKAEVGMLSDADIEMLAKTKDIFEKYAFVPCTKCAYCMPCPFGLDIPKIFEIYNTSSSRHDMDVEYKKLETLADKCKKCGKCERVCPQRIKITEEMEKVHRRLGG